MVGFSLQKKARNIECPRSSETIKKSGRVDIININYYYYYLFYLNVYISV